MCSATLVATWIALVKGSSTDSTCEDDVVLLQHSHKKVVKTKKSGSSMGPDDSGLCNWGSVFGADVPDDVAGVQDMFAISCTELYSASVCAPVAEEIFNVFDDTIPFDDQANDHPFFCAEISELIVASRQHQRELQPDMALLGKMANSALLSRMLLSTKSSGESFDKAVQAKSMGIFSQDEQDAIDALAADAHAAYEAYEAPQESVTPESVTPESVTPESVTPESVTPAWVSEIGCDQSTDVPADRPPAYCTPCVWEHPCWGTEGCNFDPCPYDSPEDNRCGMRRRRIYPLFETEAAYEEALEQGPVNCDQQDWDHRRRRRGTLG